MYVQGCQYTQMAEEKSERFQMRVSPEMLERLDDWRRKQPSIPSRSEALRRLSLIGLAFEDREEKFAEVLKGIFVSYYGLYSVWQDKPETVPAEIVEHIQAMSQPVDDFFRMMILLGAENIPMRQTLDLEQALAEVKDLRSRMVGFTRASLPGKPKVEE